MNIWIQPDLKAKHYIGEKSISDFKYCFACKSCVLECPVNNFTGKLNPLKLIRLACFGQIETLLKSSEIWYCINCHKCSNICPMKVKADSLIQFLKNEAVKRGLVSEEFKSAIEKVYADLKIVRLKLLYACFSEESIEHDDLADWEYIKSLSFEESFAFNKTAVIIRGKKDVIHLYDGVPLYTTSCLTCKECSGACPICLPPFFDPLFILRSVVLGLKEELASHPIIWLCIGCETCTEACSQGVKGHLIIKQLQKYAIESGIIDKNFPKRWNDIQKEIFKAFVNKIDSLFEIYAGLR